MERHHELDTQNKIVDLECTPFCWRICCLHGPSAAQTAAAAQKQTPPPGGPPKAFNVPAHETYTLPNGMRVTLVPYGNIPKVDISLSVRAGNLNDPRGLQGVADITGELLKEGTKTLNAKALAETIAGMGSSLDLRVGEDETAVDVDVLSEYGAAAIKLMADFAMHPLLPESELPRLKANLLRQVVVAKTQARTNRAGTLSKADVWRSSVRRRAAYGRKPEQDDRSRIRGNSMPTITERSARIFMLRGNSTWRSEESHRGNIFETGRKAPRPW